MKICAPFHGRRVVAAAFVVAAFGWGFGFYGPPVYLEAVSANRGWGLAVISGAVTLHFLAGVPVIARLPALHRRFGLARVTVVGAIVLAVGVLGWATIQEPWQLYAAALISGAGWPALGAAAVNAFIAPWFVRDRATALSTAYNGASVGGVIFSPLWAALIQRLGFAWTAIALGSLMIAAVGTLAVSILSKSPKQLGQEPDGNLPGSGSVLVGVAPEAMALRGPLRHDRSFVTLASGMSLALFAQIGLLSHLVSLLTPSLGLQSAGWAAGWSTAAAIAGRQLAGLIVRAGLNPRVLACLSLAVQSAGCATLFAGTSDKLMMLAGVTLLGLGIGNATSLPPLAAHAEFAKEDAMRVIALVVAIAQFTYAFAPALFGALREVAPVYAVYVVAGAIQGCAIAAYLFGRRAYENRS